MASQRKGRIILLNGTSSAGKTTLANSLRLKLPATFCYYASDQLADKGFRPIDQAARAAVRQDFFAGFHRSIRAFAEAGLDLLVEHIVEQQSWADDLAYLLRPFDTFWVGLHADERTLLSREQQRGDRVLGEALFHLRTHSFCHYQLEVDTSQPLHELTAQVVLAWEQRHEERDQIT